MFGKDGFLNYANLSPYSPQIIVPRFIKGGSTILDVGCNVGYLGRILKEKKCVCYGIEINKQAIKRALPFYKKIYLIDLYYPNFKLGEKYDYIVCNDILEHLPNPEAILKKLTTYLKLNGELIVALPNIGRIEFRIKHLLGNFDYETSGILHQDHLRFFTLKTAKKLLQSCGLKIEKILYSGLGARIKILPTLFSFHFIFIGKMANKCEP